MIALWDAGSVCAMLPGMSATRIVAITLGSGLACTTMTLFDLNVLRPRSWWQPAWVACGASGVASAFIAIAGLGTPYERLDLGLLGKPFPMWVVAFLDVASDAALWLKTFHNRSGASSGELTNIGHGGHLAGAAFGAIYYWIFLRRTSNARDAGVQTGLQCMATLPANQ